MGKHLDEARIRQTRLQHVWLPEAIDHTTIEEFLAAHPETRVTDDTPLIVEELFRIEHPSLPPTNANYYKQLEAFSETILGDSAETWGSWFYYPWNGCLVHVPPENVHQRLRTARNRDLITQKEQDMMAAAVVAVAGMSVGSNVVSALIASGPWREIRIADADEISLTNLNRIRTGMHEIGLPKVTSVARKIYELDPYANVVVIPEGLTIDNLATFLTDANVIIDEMDSLPMKARLRLAAKAASLPVVMVTDNGDDNLLDIERFDQDPELELFHGKLSGAVIEELMSGTLEGPAFVAAAMQIIGAEYAPVRLLKSVPQVGRSLAGVPQLGTSALIGGALVAYVTRLIVTGEDVHSGKIPVEFEKTLLPHHPQLIKERHRILDAMRGGAPNA